MSRTLSTETKGASMARMSGKSVLLSMAALVVFASSARAELEDRTLIDLTYPFDEQTIYWPHNKPFAWEQTSWGPSPGGYWYASGQFCTAEHGGTHLDAPIHFAEAGMTLDAIPLQKLIGPAVVIDVSEAARQDRDYRMTVADIEAWEEAHGKIPDGAIILMRTGWGRFWPDRAAYLGSKTPDVQEADLSARGLGTMYRVVVGPPGSHNSARGVCTQLKTAGYEGCWVKEY